MNKRFGARTAVLCAIAVTGWSLCGIAKAASGFTIEASPSSLTLAPGSSGTSTITTTGSSGFDSTITLSASGEPAGVTVSFSPTSIPAPGSGTSTMTITTAATTPGGTYTITVTGEGGGLTESTTVSLTVSTTTTITRIMAGTDYLQTQSGTEVTIPFPTGSITVPLKGVPIKGLGNVDTIIERMEDAIFSKDNDDVTGKQTANVTIQLMALNLQGSFTGSGGQACTVSITLGGASTGTVTFNLGPPMTFTSSFTVNYVAVFSPSSCGGTITGSCVLKNKGKGKWIAVPPSSVPTDPPYYLVEAPYPSPAANLHTPGSYPPGYVDFYITGLTTDAAETAKHVVCEAASKVGGTCPK